MKMGAFYGFCEIINFKVIDETRRTSEVIPAETTQFFAKNNLGLRFFFSVKYIY